MIGATFEAALGLIGVAVVGLILLTARISKGAAATLWLVSVIVVPPWMTPMAGGARIPVAAIASVAVLLSQSRNRPSWRLVDTLALSLGIVAVGAWAFGETPKHIVVQVVAEWLLPYAAGRMCLDRDAIIVISRRLAVALSLLAVIQFTTRFDLATIFPFSVANTQEFWMGLQDRGGFSRAEVTFGHSIALGGTLSILLAFVVLRRYAANDGSSLWQIVAVVAGVAVTMSRASMIGTIAVLAAAIFMLPVRALTRLLLIVMVSGGAWAAVSYFDNLASSARGAEVTDSSAYREGLLDLLSIVEPIGLAPGGSIAPDGATFTWLGYYSIDNSLLYVALYIGSIAAVLYGAIFALAILRLVRHRSSDAIVYALALGSQLPLLVTVAPITQHQAITWYFLGLATTMGYASRVPDAPVPRIGERSGEGRHA